MEIKKISLNDPGAASLLSKRVLNDIDAQCQSRYDDGHRSHLGASLIGHECSRYLWYVFRWCHKEKFDGRQLRLFNRGHREEARFVEWLKWAGFEVQEFANPDEKTQFRISGVNGHFGGSLDGIAKLPPSYGIDEPVLLEFKTNGTGAGFNKLKDGMIIAKPQHFAQTSVYGYKMQLSHVLYININKNDDSLHCEFVKLDHTRGAQLELKAEQIINATEPPRKLSTNPSYQACGWCGMKDICHNDKMPELNCRSCKHSKPVENAEWFCGLHSGNIPKDFLKQGCPQWASVA